MAPEWNRVARVAAGALAARSSTSIAATETVVATWSARAGRHDAASVVATAQRQSAASARTAASIVTADAIATCRQALFGVDIAGCTHVAGACSQEDKTH